MTNLREAIRAFLEAGHEAEKATQRLEHAVSKAAHESDWHTESEQHDVQDAEAKMETAFLELLKAGLARLNGERSSNEW